MASLNLTTLVTRSPNLVAANIDGDIVMMGIDQGEYYSISGVGSRAWELLETPISVESIVNIICDEYDADETTCQDDMQSFIEELVELGLVSVVR
jgi:hypothetical protein